ncbi:hypothetical protein SAMN04487769_1152 [Burkholderia sp. b14]|uniref:hypothetical protein n=1 Tax=Mycetohabitans sp. B7 TaxID=2841844 RepID=UPI000967116C|nr:hypothetical protein [Mycetohabitans sp. B7]MCG1039168.1 hypothetical protein [Mycetohabitans sp. B7]SIT67662.1 hypothetical protein SAMN04487769_1152 [Burkholderia sp. b14]
MQARLEALQTIVNDLRRRGWIDRQPFMIVASSEGVSIATRFATLSKNVSHLLLISGFGVGHTLATLHTALTGSGDYWGFISAPESNNPLSRLQSTLARWEQVRRDQRRNSSETIAGYQAAYWRTIGLASSAEDALASNAQLYLVQGGRDQTAPAVNYEAGIAYLITHNRPFVSEYIPCGDHFLTCPDDGEEPKNLQGGDCAWYRMVSDRPGTTFFSGLVRSFDNVKVIFVTGVASHIKPLPFRQAAQAVQRTQTLADIVLVRPVSFTILTATMATMAFGVALLFAFGSYTRRRIAGTRLDATVKPPSRYDCIEPARSPVVTAPHGRPSNAAR